MAEYDTVAIVGVGLIGGSIGLALRERRLAAKCRSASAATDRHASLRLRRRDGWRDRSRRDQSGGRRGRRRNSIVVARRWIRSPSVWFRRRPRARRTSLITDAGSTKEAIVDGGRCGAGRPPRRAAVRRQPSAGRRSSHAGRSMRGPICSRAARWSSRRPTHTRPAAVTEVSGFWQSLGAKVTTMTPGRARRGAGGDQPFAAPGGGRRWRRRRRRSCCPLTASGWRDTTRVAGGDPNLWQPIFAANRQHVLDALERFEQTCRRTPRDAWNKATTTSLLAILEAAAKRKRERDALGD